MTDQPALDDFDGDSPTDEREVDPFDPHRDEPTTRPDECLVFDVQGQWGHFKRVDGNLVKETYRIPPRTTVAGLVAAILGIDRDGYYDLFARGRSAVAVEPTTDLRTINVPVNAMSTANSSEGLQKVNSRGGGPTVVFTDPSYNRQQHNYEVLVDPAYRIYLWFEDEDRLNELDELLAEGRSHYTPSLGLSEYLASVERVGRFDVTPIEEDEPVKVDSTVPDGPSRTAVTPDTTYRMERSPGYMSLRTGTSGFTRRQTDEFFDYTYTLDASPVRVTDASDVVRAGEKNVIFR
jgi:CRISPR-associated protein Cas5h